MPFIAMELLFKHLLHDIKKEDVSALKVISGNLFKCIQKLTNFILKLKKLQHIIT